MSSLPEGLDQFYYESGRAAGAADVALKILDIGELSVRDRCCAAVGIMEYFQTSLQLFAEHSAKLRRELIGIEQEIPRVKLNLKNKPEEFTEGDIQELRGVFSGICDDWSLAQIRERDREEKTEAQAEVGE